MGQVVVVGLDIAKLVFQVHWVGFLRRRLQRTLGNPD
jgi:hypothetical protein